MSAQTGTGSGCCCMCSTCGLAFFLKVLAETQNVAVMQSLSQENVISKSLAVNFSSAIRSIKAVLFLLSFAWYVCVFIWPFPVKASGALPCLVIQLLFAKTVTSCWPQNTSEIWNGNWLGKALLSLRFTPSGGKFQTGNKAFKHTP